MVTLEHDPRKACPGLEPGWTPVFVARDCRSKVRRVGCRRGSSRGGFCWSTRIISCPCWCGVAVAGVAALGAIAVGPYGRRGVRLTLAIVSFAAFLGSALWLVTYLGWIEQRRAIEARLSELRGQALSANSTLACLEGAGDSIEKACEHTIFATPESLAAANFYTTTRFDLLMSAARYSGPRTAQFNEAIDSAATLAPAGPVRADRQYSCAAHGVHGGALRCDRDVSRPGARPGERQAENIPGYRGSAFGQLADERTDGRIPGRVFNPLRRRRDSRADPGQVHAAVRVLDPANQHHAGRAASAGPLVRRPRRIGPRVRLPSPVPAFLRRSSPSRRHRLRRHFPRVRPRFGRSSRQRAGKQPGRMRRSRSIQRQNNDARRGYRPARNTPTIEAFGLIG